MERTLHARDTTVYLDASQVDPQDIFGSFDEHEYKPYQSQSQSVPTNGDGRFMCDLCHKCYKYNRDLVRHTTYECHNVVEKPSFSLRKYRFILPKQDTAQENIDPYSQAHLLTYQDHDSKQVEYVSKRTSRVEPTTRLDVVASTSEPAIQWEDADSVYQPEKIQRWKRNSASTTHDGRFMCDLCEKTYKWKGDLNRHMKYECQYVIGKPSFDCPHCDYSTVRPSYLKYHMGMIHGKLPSN
ncbi:uncharacterized protein [Bemisia tabaci]|uniref:uncharacterized protein n=1 Tax=Bemisia tabaci TaxID=7038 RepID=UPI003B27EFAB